LVPFSLFFVVAQLCAHRYLHSFPTRRSSDLFGWLILKEKLDKVKIFSVVIAILGVVMIVGLKMSGTNVILGVLLLVLDSIAWARSEEHTSELQSRFDLVCRLLLEKKKESDNV